MRLQGIGYVKIGEMLGISDNTVRSFCRRNGLGDAAKEHGCLQALRKVDKNHPQAETRKFCSDACRTTWWNSHPDYVDRKAVYTPAPTAVSHSLRMAIKGANTAATNATLPTASRGVWLL